MAGCDTDGWYKGAACTDAMSMKPYPGSDEPGGADLALLLS